MKKQGLVWRIYRLLFLDIWHRRFFHAEIKPQNVDFTKTQIDQYLSDLNLSLKLIDEAGQEFGGPNQLSKKVTLFYGDHPSSLDAMLVYFALFDFQPWIVSFLHNQLHFAFLKNRTIPVGAKFAAREFNPLGLKMKIAHRLENLTDDECKNMNRAVPEIVAKKLQAKQNVVIFPSGGWGNWQDGIGFALDKIAQSSPELDLNLQSFKIISFREAHSVLHGWLHIFGLRVPGTIKIKFGHPISMAQLLSQPFMKLTDQKSRAKAIRSWLETDYQRI